MKHKLDHLRRQPEADRLRAATTLTAAASIIVGILWLVVLLPLQLRFARNDRSQPLPEQQLVNEIQETNPLRVTPQPQVGGVQDELLPTQRETPFVSPSPTPTHTEDGTLPVEQVE